MQLEQEETEGPELKGTIPHLSDEPKPSPISVPFVCFCKKSEPQMDNHPRRWEQGGRFLCALGVFVVVHRRSSAVELNRSG